MQLHMLHGSHKVLNGKAIELEEQGLGKRKHRADLLTEEELLWSWQVLGADTAPNLNLTILHDQSAVCHLGMPITSSAEGRTLEVCQQPLD